MLPEAINVMMLVVDVFERLQIPYLIGGSMASAFYAVARSTLDAGMVAEIHLEEVGTLVKALDDDFYADEEMIRAAIRHHSSFNLIHRATMFKVDIFIRKERPFERVQSQRRVEQPFATNPEQKACIEYPINSP